MFDQSSLKLVELLCTYFLHSSALLTCAWLLKKCGALQRRGIAEAVWKFAFWGSFLSAGFVTSFESPMQVTVATLKAGPTSRSNTPHSLEPQAISLPLTEEQKVSQAQKRSEPHNIEQHTIPIRAQTATASSFFSELSSISIPTYFKPYFYFFAFAWLGFVLITMIQFALRIVTLNRQVMRYPHCPPDLLNSIIDRKFPNLRGKIRIKYSEIWNSPIVAPNNVICIPEWTFGTLSTRQIEVMIAHELAHVQRRDPAWSIIYRFLTSVFFFQPMNIIAERELNNLAELACDEIASSTSSEKRDLAETLFACASAQANLASLPKFALAMAKPNSPLVMRVHALIEVEPSQSPLNAKLVYMFGSLGVLSAAMLIPSVQINFPTMAGLNPFASPQHLIPLAETIIQKVASKNEPRSLQIQTREPVKQTTPINQDNYKTNAVAFSGNLITASANNESAPTHDVDENRVAQLQEKWSLEEAKLALNAKKFAEAVDIIQHLANNHDTKAQALLGAMYWNGEGLATNLDEAEKWFRLAAARGDQQAINFIRLIDERAQKKNAIQFYVGETQVNNFKYLDDKCQTPVYSTSLFASNNKALEIWNKCAKKYSDALKTAKAQDQLIVPTNLLAILTEKEIRKAEENSSSVIDRAIESISVSKLEMQRGLNAWNDAHPNLITNEPFNPGDKLPETSPRTPDYRLVTPPMPLKQNPP